MKEDKIPLCVDLDGTLIRTDLLIESLLILIKQKPWAVFLIPFWLLRGKAVLKEEIATRVDLNVETLPYQAELMEFLRREHAAGRSLILATASPRKFADGVAEHLGIFTKVLATDEGKNLAGRVKRDLIVKHYGPKCFDYAGNSRSDIHVWGMARQAIVVNPDSGVLQGAMKQCPISHTFTDQHPGVKTYAKALRVHQWLKNVLIFIPMLAAHQISA